MLEFQLNATVWDLVNPLNVPFQLNESGGDFTLMDPQSQRRYSFDSDGLFTMAQDRNGNTHTMSYTDNNLTQVSDGLGAAITVTVAVTGPPDSRDISPTIWPGPRKIRRV